MRQAFSEAALTKEDVIDIVNVGIETLVRHCYELPAFNTWVREARVQRVSSNQALFAKIHDVLTQMRGEPLSTSFLLSAMTRVGLAPGMT
jgi:hypothetical protein